MNERGSSATISSLTRAQQVIEYVSSHDGVRIVDVGKALQLPKATAYRYLSTLEQTGIVVKESNQYYISLQMLYFGGKARERYDRDGLIQDSVKTIANDTQERAQFLVLEQEKAVFLFRELGRRAVKTDTRIGKPMPMHATSGGKVILAYLSNEEREQLITDLDFEAYTNQTITTLEDFRSEIETIRSQGYAVNREEYLDRLLAVSVPVKLANVDTVGAIGVSGPTPRIKRKMESERLVEYLRGTANEIELRYAHQAKHLF